METTTQVSIYQWMDKEDVACIYIYVYMAYIYLFQAWKRTTAICENVDGTWGYYSKWNKSEKERQILRDLSYMWNLKKPNP